MEDYADYVIDSDPTPGGHRFSRREIGDILIAILVLSVAFMILYRNNTVSWYLGYEYGDTMKWVILFAICLVLVFFSFLLHEFGHKFTAQRYGMWSEFRMYPMGLVITLVTSLCGFLFAAPGAVMIRGYADKEANGRIGIAGPIVNIILSAVGILALSMIGGGDYWVDDIEVPLFLIFMMFASLNAFLALFNLIPVGPLDGKKIFSWNMPVWLVAFLIALAEIIYVYAFMPDITIWYSV